MRVQLLLLCLLHCCPSCTSSLDRKMFCSQNVQRQTNFHCCRRQFCCDDACIKYVHVSLKAQNTHAHTRAHRRTLCQLAQSIYLNLYGCVRIVCVRVSWCACVLVRMCVCVTASKLPTEKCCVFSPSKVIYPQNLCCVGPLTFSCVSFIIFN